VAVNVESMGAERDSPYFGGKGDSWHGNCNLYSFHPLDGAGNRFFGHRRE